MIPDAKWPAAWVDNKPQEGTYTAHHWPTQCYLLWGVAEAGKAAGRGRPADHAGSQAALWCGADAPECKRAPGVLVACTELLMGSSAVMRGHDLVSS